MDGDKHSTDGHFVPGEYGQENNENIINQRNIDTDLMNNEQNIDELNIKEESDNVNKQDEYERLLGHKFNEKWQLVDREGKPFEFDVYNDSVKNNDRYNQIGDRMTQYIYDLLSSKCNLQKLFIPIGSQGPGFIFVSKDLVDEIIGGQGGGTFKKETTATPQKKNENLKEGRENETNTNGISNEGVEENWIIKDGVSEGGMSKDEGMSKDGKKKDGVSEGGMSEGDKVMLLIHGSGVVRAGQWARRIIMNNDLLSGSQLPFITTALSQGYRVVVYNGNHVTDHHGNPIKDLETPLNHGRYVWEDVMERVGGRVFIVAHSYGGLVALKMATEHPSSFLHRVAAIAFTDSYALNSLATHDESHKSGDDDDGGASDDDSWKSCDDDEDGKGDDGDEGGKSDDDDDEGGKVDDDDEGGKGDDDDDEGGKGDDDDDEGGMGDDDDDEGGKGDDDDEGGKGDDDDEGGKGDDDDEGGKGDDDDDDTREKGDNKDDDDGGFRGSLTDFFKKRSREWVVSDLELDQEVSNEHGFQRLSAGHPKHEWTSTTSMSSIFSFFQQHWRPQQSNNNINNILDTNNNNNKNTLDTNNNNKFVDTINNKNNLDSLNKKSTDQIKVDTAKDGFKNGEKYAHDNSDASKRNDDVENNSNEHHNIVNNADDNDDDEDSITSDHRDKAAPKVDVVKKEL